ncbi:MAG: CDP-glycerol:glycerophosphate glycerophosphotransferase [Bifidobacteriaceae bacterium]|nr:CDP-glycerol:glycerophosphate glycerophosphotransferase [Bifidobacteriaceae bacterium]
MASIAARHPGSPLFSVVTAVYNVARYLPDFIASIERQSFALDRVEILAVDDGSTDSSLAVLEAWAARRPGLVRILRQPNAGQGSARNLGLEQVRGEWVTFIDPDDAVSPGYFTAVARGIERHPEADMVATKRIIWNDTDDRRSDTHPSAPMFQRTRLINIAKASSYFHGSVPSAFFKVAALRSAGIRFDPRIRPNFEDGHFCSRYLLARAEPKILFLADAEYYYRKRADQSSTLQSGISDPRRFADVPKYGYLALLEEGRDSYGSPPRWLQSFVLYELYWYFATDTAVSSRYSLMPGPLADQFLETLRRIAALLDRDIVEHFTLLDLKNEWREILIYSLTGQSYVSEAVTFEKFDPPRRHARFSYRFFGPEPPFECLADGIGVEPTATKVRSIDLFAHTLLYERIIWLKADGDLEIRVGGRPLPVATCESTAQPVQVGSWLNSIEDERRQTWQPFPRWYTPGDILAIILSRVGRVRAKYAHAWALMDWVVDADENAERLFRYLRRRRPDINAFFILKRGVPDWKRLKRAGYGPRLIPYGSLRWRVLMLSAETMVSSHINQEVLSPVELMRLPLPAYSFVFLQHGVIRDDISRWLSAKRRIDLMVTTTPAEHASIVADCTPYFLTSKEVTMAGLARFDRLGELGKQYPPERRDYVLIAPTWRQELSVGRPTRPGERVALTDDFSESEFARNWLGLLRDRDFLARVEAAGKQVAFLPHQNLSSIVGDLRLPPEVKVLGFAGQDVQRHFARAAVMVTDYSSMQFNAAFLGRPVVYFQFDRETYFSGPHPSRVGYFDYARDGFGPVAETLDQVKRAIVGILDEVPALYRERMDAAFPVRDGRNCERTVQAIEELGTGFERPVPLRLGWSAYKLLTQIADHLGPTSRLRRWGMAAAASARRARRRHQR